MIFLFFFFFFFFLKIGEKENEEIKGRISGRNLVLFHIKKKKKKKKKNDSQHLYQITKSNVQYLAQISLCITLE